MPIYKLVRLPSGKEIRLAKGESNQGGEVLHWGIERVKGTHTSYTSALKQLQAIKAEQGRRARMSKIYQHPQFHYLFTAPKPQVLVEAPRRKTVKVTEHDKTSILGNPFSVDQYYRRPPHRRARTVILPQHYVSVEDQIARLGEEAVHAPLVEEERRRVGRIQPEGRMRPEELKPFLLFDKPVIPPQPLPGRLTTEEIHQLQLTRPSQVNYLRWDHDLMDYVVDTRLLRDNQPIEMIKGVDLEVAEYLKKKYNIITVGDYREAVRQFVEANPELMPIQDYIYRDVGERKRNIINMWRQLPPNVQDEVWLQLDEVANIDPDTVPPEYGLKETERIVGQALAQFKLQEEARMRMEAVKEPSKAGRPKQIKTIKELEKNKIAILTNTRIPKGQRNRKAGRITREINTRKYTNKLERILNNIDKTEAKLGHLEEAERLILALEGGEGLSRKQIRKTIQDNFHDGQITMGKISYQPRFAKGERVTKRPIETIENNPENNIDTFIFIDKEPAIKHIRTGRKARLYDPLYIEGEDKFLLNNKQVNYSGIQFKREGKVSRIGGRGYYNKDDINVVLAAIEAPNEPYPPARFIGEDEQTKSLPYLIQGGLGQPLIFSTKKGYFAIQPSKTIKDIPSIRARKEANI